MSTYWFDVFTPATWEEARSIGLTVTGFSESKRGTVEQVQPGDIFICYLKGSMKLVGALRATGKPYFSSEPRIWKSNAFPARVPVEPVVALEAEDALDFRELLPHLSFHNAANLKQTWARLQGSPTRLKTADGELLFAALRGHAPGLKSNQANNYAHSTRASTGS